MKNKGYAKFWGANKVHYGKCASGVLYLTVAPFYLSTGLLLHSWASLTICDCVFTSTTSTGKNAYLDREASVGFSRLAGELWGQEWVSINRLLGNSCCPMMTNAYLGL